MPHLSSAVIKPLARRWTQLALGATAMLAGAAFLPGTALASHSQVAMIQDGSDLANPAAAMQTFRQLGATTVRVIVPWAQIAPGTGQTRKPSFNPTDPNAYPAAAWAPFDGIVQAAKQYGLTAYFDVTGGAPRWAEAQKPQGSPGESLLFLAWKPNAADFGQFVRAVGTRYDGHFTPKGQSSALPAVHFWSIFNEPNFGEDLGPQAINNSRTRIAPMMFRNLLNAGWSALHATGHSRDTILWGEFAAQGFEYHAPYAHAPQGLPGNYGQTRPLLFLRDLYCVDSSYHELRGSAASSVGCPTSAAASRRFRSQNPALFSASGVSDHPYPQTASPVSNAGNAVDYATFPDLGKMESELDRLNRVYGSGKHFSIYNTEYGYITNPPHPRYLSPATAATYINWAEYLSWRSGRIASTMQYLLEDPPANAGIYAGFASGLYFSNGKPKATLAAYEMPLYMPKTSLRNGQSAEVWGEARPARAMAADSHQTQSVQIQFQPSGHGVWQTVSTQKANGYFDTHVRFPTGGNVRLAYKYPTTDPFLPVGVSGTTLYSRTVKIS